MRTFLAALLALAVLALSAVNVVHEVRYAKAVHAASTQSIATYTGTVSAETTVLTGPTSSLVSVYSVDLAAVSTGSVWTFRDGTAGTAVWYAYLPADSPQKLTKSFGQFGLVLTQNKLTAEPASASTLAFNARYSSR